MRMWEVCARKLLVSTTYYAVLATELHQHSYNLCILFGINSKKL